MKLLIGIATYKRTAKLKKCIDSILNHNYQDFSIEVVADNNDFETIDFVNALDLPIVTLVQEKQSFVIGAWNRVVQENIDLKYWDGFIGLCDDVQLYPHALKNIVEIHQSAFPDTDGVCGFNQVCEGHQNYSFKWFGQTLIGRKFIERYKEVNYKICCPDYYHFVQDEEMWEYAISLGKFINCETAILNHYHPSFMKEQRDETHDLVRHGQNSPKNHDFQMAKERQKVGYLWGKNFSLIGKNKLGESK